MKNIRLENDINVILSSKAWKIITTMRKVKNTILNKTFSYLKIKKEVRTVQNMENFLFHVKLSTREQDKIIFFREGGFIEDWN
jgi:hypothetical protein